MYLANLIHTVKTNTQRSKYLVVLFLHVATIMHTQTYAISTMQFTQHSQKSTHKMHLKL